MATPRGLDRRLAELELQLISWFACRLQEGAKVAGETTAAQFGTAGFAPSTSASGQHPTSTEPVHSGHVSYPALTSDTQLLHPKPERAQGAGHHSGVRSSASHILMPQGASDHKQPKAPQSSAPSAQPGTVSTNLQRVVACVPH